MYRHLPPRRLGIKSQESVSCSIPYAVLPHLILAQALTALLQNSSQGRRPTAARTVRRPALVGPALLPRLLLTAHPAI